MYHNVNTKRILAQNTFASNDTWTTGLNNNDLLVGPAGAGKTRGYVIPNLLHTGENLIVADTKGNLRRLYGTYLEEKGYTVMHLDFTDVANTPWGYNEQDIKKVAQAVCPCKDFKDPFWDLAAQMYLEAILLFLLNQLPQEQHNLYEAYTFLSRMGSEELEDIIEEERITHPHSAFARKIGMIRQNKQAEKMDSRARRRCSCRSATPTAARTLW